MINSYDNPTNRIVETIVNNPQVVKAVNKRFGVHPTECQQILTILFHHFDYPEDTKSDMQELFGAIYPDITSFVTFCNKRILAPLEYEEIKSK
ncbi:hypothetical protein JR736_004579 [Escherichia coli]|nr:hypothetical protein [Escherichia coli]ELO2703253.1 hypothetical protein [Escherichia coli]